MISPPSPLTYFGKPVVLGLILVGLLLTPRLASAASVMLDPASGPAGIRVIADGSGWPAGMQVRVKWDDGQVLAQTSVDAGGRFTLPFRVPAAATPGPHTVVFETWVACLELVPPCLLPQATVSVTFTVIGALMPVVATVAVDHGDGAPYQLGEPVRFTLAVTNTGPTPAILTLPSGQRYDFLVHSSDGAEVWRWSRGKAFPLLYGQMVLAPGETLTYSETWDQRDTEGRQVAAGTYTVTGIFTSDPRLASQPRSFIISAVPAAAGFFAGTPAGRERACPGPGQWQGLYWRGETTPALSALQACPNADRLWVRRGTAWLGAAPDQPEVSDAFAMTPGEFALLHGRP